MKEFRVTIQRYDLPGWQLNNILHSLRSTLSNVFDDALMFWKRENNEPQHIAIIQIIKH